MEKETKDKEAHVELSVMEMLKNAIGLDLTRFTVPVTYNEPTTFLQRCVPLRKLLVSNPVE
jgi:hypothetical protein